MKYEKGKLIILFVLFVLLFNLCLINFCNAQVTGAAWRDKTPAQRAQFQTDMMRTKLGLDANQLSQAQAINLKYALTIAPILKENGSKLNKIQRIKSLQEQKDKELKQVFSAAQFQQYQTAEQQFIKKISDAHP
ncbi:hypothetical protein GA0116948_110159 [Chitinophaga costaii]|uniref:LTXXQ motif family protein n=1 Tax=Chitinophaga costaii TaxID=1335309 RepID=A0A1C4F095_9BACT|nr:hypothetical protein [Chitinophaga costaii]PUZ21508.1 hypothetical protein DCM91_15845 [Chitinophaga costaii]SCC49095.1 hypothetical protein GA0116948_110159 [Chitinophaga costaii]